MDDPELKSLEDRLKKARAPHNSGASDDEKEQSPSHTGMAWRMGMELVTGVAVGLFLGTAIDDWLDTKPVAMVILVFLGFAAGIRNVMISAKKMQDQAYKDDAEDS